MSHIRWLLVRDAVRRVSRHAAYAWLVGIGVVACSLMTAAVLAEQAGPITAGDQEQVVDLSAKDLTGWREPHGQWAIVGEAVMDPQEPKRLAVKPGTGVLYNGPQGRTVNLLSVAEHGDVIAHIEFMVPKGSNSVSIFKVATKSRSSIAGVWKSPVTAIAAVFTSGGDHKEDTRAIPHG